MSPDPAGSSAELVLSEDRGPVRVVTINRAEVRNAIDMPTRVALAEALEAADGAIRVRAVVLTGAAPTFCSGGDIASMRRMSRDEAVPRAQAAQRIIRAIWGTSKPVVAAVEGAAYGAGMSLALACDRVVASREARFAPTFSRVGLAGDMGIFASLAARVGPHRAKQLLMFPDPVSGDAAVALGLVDRAVDPGAALDAALEDADHLASMAAGALGVVKRTLSGEPRHPAAVLELEVQNQADLFGSDDFAEGVAAFAERRAPRFGTTPGRDA
ncbi:enoyl-CoA hydratase/isomerase family protein [Aeromicrobium alkaliterrae]|uniref:Enoyl-CoA hydratase/isomerase family protein n=1 Tax=Aeromicrobium alkaliterrae TaxID=302168 RepID=A0ABN2K8A4_9ACTN